METEYYVVYCYAEDYQGEVYHIEAINPLQAREYARDSYRRENDIRPHIPVYAKTQFTSSDPKESTSFYENFKAAIVGKDFNV